MDEDLGRYRSAAGWDPLKKYKRQLEKARREMAIQDRLLVPILRVGGDEPPHPRGGEELFATLWRTGEVALLYGEPGVSKSIFAARLAEAIATGHDWTAGDWTAGDWTAGIPACESDEITPHPRRVAHIDLQRTDAQSQQRFPDPSFQRLHFDWAAHNPEETDNDRARHIHFSIHQAIADGAEVVVLDDITLGGINIGRPNGPLRTLRTLKKFAAENGTSFLVIAGARPHRRPRAASLSDVAFRHIAEQSDSVFSLSASTYGPAFRYIRHLRSTSGPIIHDASAVLTFQFESNEFKYLGDCAESEHLRDYAAETLRTQRAEEHQRKRSLKRSNKTFLIEGMLDGRFQKYLNGK